MQLFSNHLFTLLGFCLAVLLIARLLREHKPPANTMAWLLAILLIPYVGVPLYFLLGGRKIRRLPALLDSPPSPLPAPISRSQSDTERVLISSGAAAAREGNHVTLMPHGQEAFEALVKLIDEAKESISLTAFILSRDEVGSVIIERLAEKARQGVKVRLLLDALGSFRSTGRFLAPLRKAGGSVGIFLPVLPLRRKWSANLRNHRKIWIADDKRALVGGRNIATEYMGPKPSKSRWHDFNMALEGPSVTDLAQVFASDWKFVTGEVLTPKVIPPDSKPDLQSTTLQVVAAGPDTSQDALYQGVLTSIFSAKERIWIVTPYFVPDEGLLQALMLAAKLGRDVRLIVPKTSNHPLTDLVRGSYLRELIRSGAKCYAFKPGMLHTKLLVMDSAHAVVGSANMDMRSLYLNYEIAVFVYSQGPVHQIAKHVLEVLSESELIEFPHSTSRERLRIWFEDVSRLFAPLL